MDSIKKAKTFNDRITEMYIAYCQLQKLQKEPKVWDFDECDPSPG
jgi:hypothetical protein